MHTLPSLNTRNKGVSSEIDRWISLLIILTVWVEHLTGELHLRRTQWVVRWENKFGWKDASFETSPFRTTIKKLICSYSSMPTNVSLATYVISASHSKKLSSVTGPATIPSGGFNVSSGI